VQTPTALLERTQAGNTRAGGLKLKTCRETISIANLQIPKRPATCRRRKRSGLGGPLDFSRFDCSRLGVARATAKGGGRGNQRWWQSGLWRYGGVAKACAQGAAPAKTHPCPVHNGAE
jgi:hypothetical protein